MSGGHHPTAVVLSVIIAILASYTALQLAGRVSAARGWVRLVWLASGSVAMGVGIWSMHFVAMLAFHLPVPIEYDIPLWLMSIGIAVLASALALFIASRSRVSVPTLAVGGLLMGAGIAGMHYTGMAAMRFPGHVNYDPTMVALSIAIAVFCAFTALVLSRRFRDARTIGAAWAMAGSGVIMGFAIAGLHYTGMAAARFTLDPVVHVAHEANLLATRDLTVTVVVGTLLILGLALVGSLLDRHLRVRDEEAAALRESRRAMATLLGNLPGMAYRCRNDAGRRIEFASDGALDLSGYAPEALAGSADLSFARLIHPADAARVAEELQRALRDQRVFHLTYRLITASGEERWASEQGQGVYTPEGEVLAIEGFVTDVTERKRASQLNARLATIVESTSDAIISTTVDGTILTWNRGAEQTYGYTADAAVGQNVGVLLGQSDPRDHREVAAQFERGETTSLDTTRTHRSGTTIDVALTLSAIRDASGQVIGISSISRDITLRKRAEEELIRARDAAEAANRAKSDFLASMSHELRTPLNSVIGFANVLRKNKAGNLRAQDLQFLERIVGSGKHLLSLINDVLDLSKIEAGKMEVELAPVSLSALVTETIAELQGNVRDGVVLKTRVPGTELLIDSDAGKLKQVLINLVGNALKFTEQGSVTLAVETDPTTGEPLRIVVQDTGIGIPAERLASIFQPFEQAESGTARRFGGTGLGLAISASLCGLLGYQVTVDSAVGLGSAFSISLAPDQATVARGVGGESRRLDAVSDASARTRTPRLVGQDDETGVVRAESPTDYGCNVLVASGRPG